MTTAEKNAVIEYHEIDGMTFYEIDPDMPWIFQGALLDSKESHKHGAAVDCYEVEEYERMRLFLTPDLTAGFALDGDNIISGFVHPRSRHRGCVGTMLALAISLGGRRTDCFDPVLPSLYAPLGMVPVSRLTWNDNYAPEGWDYALSGRPDVVFMAYDPEAVGREYVPGAGKRVDDYALAVQIQDAYVNGFTLAA